MSRELDLHRERQIHTLANKLNEIVDKVNLLLRDYALSYDNYKKHVVEKVDVYDVE